MARKAFGLRAPPRKIEAEAQIHVVKQLRAYLPDDIWWTCSLAGVRLSMHVAVEAKRMGNQRGAPDLSFVFPDRITYYIDMKAAYRGPTPEQARLKAMLGDRFVFCKTWADVHRALEGWMTPLDLKFLTDRESIRRGRATLKG